MNARDKSQGRDGFSFSRREMVALLGVGGFAALLASCNDSNASHIVKDLPDPLAPSSPFPRRCC